MAETGHDHCASPIFCVREEHMRLAFAPPVWFIGPAPTLMVTERRPHDEIPHLLRKYPPNNVKTCRLMTDCDGRFRAFRRSVRLDPRRKRQRAGESAPACHFRGSFLNFYAAARRRRSTRAANTYPAPRTGLNRSGQSGLARIFLRRRETCASTARS